jgi:cystine transport system permease protein
LQHTLSIIENALWPILEAGFTVTIPLALISFALSLVLAVLTAVMRISKSRLLKGLAWFYVWVFRGTPLLIQLFIVFFGLPKLNITLDAWTAAILTFALNSGAYSAESIRGAILSIPRGQWEAADSLGMTHGQVLKRIIFPQTVRIALPAVMNDFISLVKSTSLASSITIIEMTMVGQQFASVTYEPLILYMEVAVIYLLISTVLTWIQGKLEIRTSKYLKKA